MKRQRPLIAALFATVHDECQSIVWSGVADYANAHGIDLITFVATSQNRVSTFDAHYRIVRDLLRSLAPDGILIYTGALSDHFNPQELTEYCHSLGTCPMVGISQKVAGLKAILIDNAQGVRKSVHHLLTTHRCRTFAFIKGVAHHMESEARFQAFQTELRNNGIEVDPTLVFKGHFVKASGEEAALRIIESGRIPDAIIAVNDSTALGVISALHRHGIHVPADVKVAGFDDVPEAADSVPALTTVRQPLYEIGQIAMQSLLDEISPTQDADPKDIYVPTQFIPRNSCGCTPPLWGSKNSQASTSLWQVPTREALVSLSADIVTRTDPNISAQAALTWAQTLLAAFPQPDATANDDKTPDFITVLNNILVQHISLGGDPSVWQEVLNAISQNRHVLANGDADPPQPDDLLQRARICVGDLALRKTLSDEFQKEDMRTLIRSILLNLITSFDIDRLKQIVQRDLPAIGINACHMVLFGTEGVQGIDMTAPQPARSRLVLSFNQNTQATANAAPLEFTTANILPEPLWAESWHRDHLLFPLVFEKQCFGYILFQDNPNLPKDVYEELRIHISSALRGHSLITELREMSLRDELTKLYNRRGFIHLCNLMLRQARRTGSRLTIMYGDLNKLKHINDTYGHAEGDFAISQAAAILRRCIREQDVLARIGGDEFTLMATDMDAAACTNVIERIDTAFAAFNDKREKPYAVSISIGYTIEDVTETTSVDDMLVRADAMLFEIKRKRAAQRS